MYFFNYYNYYYFHLINEENEAQKKPKKQKNNFPKGTSWWTVKPGFELKKSGSNCQTRQGASHLQESLPVQGGGRQRCCGDHLRIKPLMTPPTATGMCEVEGVGG